MATPCPACGTPVETPFCGRCGAPVSGSPPTSGPPAWQPAAPSGQPYLLAPAAQQPRGARPAQGHPPAPLLAPAQPPAQHTQRRNAQVIGWSAAVLIALGAAWVAVEGFDTGRSERTLRGTFTLYDEAFLDVEDDETCTGEDAGYDELEPDSDVVVMDGDGDVLDRTLLGRGFVDGAGCVFEFRTRVARASRYQVEAALGNGVSYTEDELEGEGWEVELSLGDEDLDEDF